MRYRLQSLFVAFSFVLSMIVLRLSYWQIVRGDELSLSARNQYISRDILQPSRGSITTADGYPLVINRPVFALGSYTPSLQDEPSKIVDLVLPLLNFSIDDPAVATDPAKLSPALDLLKETTKTTMLDKLSRDGYSVLSPGLSATEKDAIAQLSLAGLSFDPSYIRQYPEASLSAHITGFVGRDDLGKPRGYFGLEGYYDRELAGIAGVQKQEKDAGGNPLLIGDFQSLPSRDGRNLTLYLDRGAQYLVERELRDALSRYGASSGEVLVMDPTTGGILAMASLPTYDPSKFHLYDTALYKNPAIANTYEPGSTFKVLVMAAAFNEKVLQLDDHCDICAEPVTIGKYTIKTWNNEYRDGATPKDIIVHSDNVGMVWTAGKLGNDKLLSYIQNFGFGEKTGIDLEEEVTSQLRSRWGDIDYATSSFGQGIAVTSIQMLRAVAAIANGGELLVPHVVKSVDDLPVSKKIVRRVISPEAASQITQLMIAAVEEGEAQWAAPKNYTVAGKTGTAQIAVSGHYDAEKTIASFVGFAPAHNPRFVMLVKLREPQSSQWGSETAAPLWFRLASQLLLHYNVPPDK